MITTQIFNPNQVPHSKNLWITLHYQMVLSQCPIKPQMKFPIITLNKSINMFHHNLFRMVLNSSLRMLLHMFCRIFLNRWHKMHLSSMLRTAHRKYHTMDQSEGHRQVLFMECHIFHLGGVSLVFISLQPSALYRLATLYRIHLLNPLQQIRETKGLVSLPAGKCQVGVQLPKITATLT